MSIDTQFIKRVYRTTLWVAAVILLCLTRTADLKIVGGFAIGTGIALALLKSHEIIVPRVFAKDGERSKRRNPLLTLMVLKYVGLGALLWLLLAHEWVNPVALFAGFVLVQAVIFLKVVGLLVIAKMGIPTEKR